MKIIGIKIVDYIRKVDGSRVRGIEVYYTYPSKNIEGLGCDRAFISLASLDRMGGEIPPVGSDVDFIYNRFGKVVGFSQL